MDPSGERARNVLLLVTLTVALPSLLLTGLGAVAVSNEESASKARLERQFRPVVAKTAERFNATMDEMLAQAGAQLPSLAAWAQGAEQGGQTPPDLSAAAFAPFAVSYFVVDEQGTLLLPRPSTGEDPTSPMPAPLREALEHELGHEDKGACDRYPPIASSDAPGHCLARWAWLACQAASAAEWEAGLVGECAHLASDPLTAPARRLRSRSPSRQASPDAFVAEAREVLRALAAPTQEGSPWLQELVARDAAARLVALRRTDARVLRQMLLTRAERASLLVYMKRLAHQRDAAPATVPTANDNWARLALTTSKGGTLIGLELVPTSFDQMLTAGLPQSDLAGPTEAILYPVRRPPWWHDPTVDADKLDAAVMAEALMKKSGLAWALSLVPTDRERAINLQTRRSLLYLWALVLVAGCLVAGIVYTVRSITREARQSRLKVDFVSSVSHDLRTPLTSIRMFTETLLLGRVKSRDEERECLEVIARETERLSRLTQRILDFSRMEAGRHAYVMKEEPLADLVQQALDACRPLVEQDGFTVEKRLSPEAPTARVDRDAIVEVLINLMTNAIKYSPDIRWIEVATDRYDGGVELSVADRGIGIGRGDQARIFEKFFRVDCPRTAEVGGCGIGLSLVRHIVDAHGGRVVVQSEPGRGSTFTVRLPATAKER
ncbi:MAG: HAMP domain-containing histidine kinase [Deltaproteobacteria bacterium]|nr:HAMP domain-containing histidine kinase [Deltaproteobacteria bacterium]